MRRNIIKNTHKGFSCIQKIGILQLIQCCTGTDIMWNGPFQIIICKIPES